MASHRLSVFTQEKLAEQARSVFASRARAVPPPARSVPLPAQQRPDHLCRVGSPHPGRPQGGERSAAGGDTPGPPPLTHTKAASLLTSACITHRAPKIPGGGSWWRGGAGRQLGPWSSTPGCPTARDGRWGYLQSGGCSETPAQSQPHISHRQEPTPPGRQEEGGKTLLQPSWGPRGGQAPGGTECWPLLGGLLLLKPQNLPRAKAEQAPEPAPGAAISA